MSFLKPPMRFYNSTYKVQYTIAMLTNNAIVPPMVTPPIN